MALLDALLSPQAALAAGLLRPSPSGTFGGGLSQGITQGLAAQRAQLFAALQRQQLQKEMMRQQQAARARQLFANALGTRPTQTAGGLLGGTGALADNQVDAKELQALALDQLRIGNVAGVNSVLGYINATTPQTKTELVLAAAGGDKQAREALHILNGTTEVKPLSQVAKINADLKNGLITQAQADQQINAIGRSPGMKERFIAPILLKLQQGIPLTEGESQVRDFFKTVNPFDEFIRAAMKSGNNATSNEEQLLQQAREALAQGKDRAAVEQVLRDRGIDPAKLLSQGTVNR